MPLFRHDGQLHLFVHVPKCGGTSIEQALTARFGSLAFLTRAGDITHHLKAWPACAPQHIHWSELQKVVPADWLSSSFGVVRHPVSRLVSAYNMRARAAPAGIWASLGLEAFLDHYLTFRAYDPYFMDNHLRPQTEFFPPMAKTFELEKGLEAVARHLETQFGLADEFAISTENKTYLSDEVDRIPLEMTPTLRDKVLRTYESDFEAYGYDEEPETPPKIFRSKAPRSPFNTAAWQTKQKLRLVYKQRR